MLIELMQYELGNVYPVEPQNFQQAINSEKLLSLIKRHRLTPTAYNQLKKYTNLPYSFSSQLHREYETNTRKMLSLASEMVRLFSLLEENQVPFLALKGPLFAKQCYGEFNLRQSRDIDMIIHPEHLQQAELLLKEHGYIRISPDIELTPKQYKMNLKNTHEYSFRHPEGGNLIEMHWRLFTLPSQFPLSTIELFEEAEDIDLGGKKLKVLNPKHRLFYLLIHGSIHNWFRLFWLRDIGQMLNTYQPDIEQLVKDSEKLGTERSIIQGLILCKLLLGSSIPDSIIKKYSSSPLLQKLVKSSLHSIFTRAELNTTKKIARLYKPIYLTRLRREWKYKFHCIYKLRTNVSDWKLIKLPDSLFFLYYILRPFTWFINAYVKSNNRKQADR